MFAEARGTSDATFVLLVVECVWGSGGLRGGDDFSLAATTSNPTGLFFTSGFRRSQCLDQAAPARATISADTNRPRRSAPPRKLGVKLPRARRNRLALGSDLLKSSEGFGRNACSAAVHWAVTGLVSVCRELPVKTLAATSFHRLFGVDPGLDTSIVPSVGVAGGTVLVPFAGTC